MRQASKRAGLNSTTEVKQDSSSRKGSGFAIRNQPDLATAFCRIVSRKGAVRNLVAERRVGDSRLQTSSKLNLERENDSFRNHRNQCDDECWNPVRKKKEKIRDQKSTM